MALSLSGALLGGSAAWAEEATSSAPEQTAVVASDAATTTASAAAVTPASEPAAEAAPAPAPAATPKLDTGDTAWILISTALVLLMTIPGLALFYGGMVRKKNVLATMAHSFMAAVIVSIESVS